MQSGRIVAKRKRADRDGKVSQSMYATAMVHKRVLTLDLLVSLTARHWAFVEHARSTWVFDLQRGHDIKHHRHDVSRGRSNPQSIVVCFDTRESGLTGRTLQKRGRCPRERSIQAGHASPVRNPEEFGNLLP